MALCNRCGGEFEWAMVDGRWVLLEPINSHDDLDKIYQDDDGVYRADHRDRHGDPVKHVRMLNTRIKARESQERKPVKRSWRQRWEELFE